jgi:hypothetical protein
VRKTATTANSGRQITRNANNYHLAIDNDSHLDIMCALLIQKEDNNK